MRHNYPYLKDSAFLLKIDKQKIKEQYIKIICLDINERPLKEVQGRCTGGSLNLSGSSAVRRTCNLSMIADEKENDLTDLDNLFSTNKRVEVEIGFLNTTEYYTQFDIIWFPLGIYVIKTPSITHNTTSVDISLTLEDKMCLLNGTMGGKFPASVEFSRMEDEFGNLSYPTMYQIILELVHHFGGEQLSKIIINDLDEYVKVPKRWMPKDGLLLDGKQIEDICIEFSENIPVDENNDPRPLKYTFISADAEDTEVPSNFHRYKKGDWIGFTYEPFTYPGCETGDENKQLVGNAGENVCTILDKIKNVLGNFEYFYDINGNFIFQEIKNYLNTSQFTTVLDNNGNVTSGYDMDISRGKSVYSFTDNMLVTDLSNNPQYEMIKNDYVVWGTREGESGEKVPIRYHLAIDEKPQVGNWYAIIPYREIINRNDYINLPEGTEFTRKLSDVRKFYIIDSAKNKEDFNWEELLEKQKNDIYLQNALKNELIYPDPDCKKYTDDFLKGVKGGHQDFGWLYGRAIYQGPLCTQDWRTELYIQGALSEQSGTYSNYYYPELKNEWGKLFYLKKINEDQYSFDYFADEFQPSVLADPAQIDFFLDFINTDSKMGELNIENIGRRSEVMNGENQGVNCMFEPHLPDIIFLRANETDNRGYPYIIDRTLKEAAAAVEKNWNFSSPEKTDTSIGWSEGSDAIGLIDNLATVFSLNSAFFNVRDLLYQHTSYNEAITLQTIPIYYLEPNTRITVKDIESGISGDYMIGTISIPFDIGSTMSITAQKVLEKI